VRRGTVRLRPLASHHMTADLRAPHVSTLMTIHAHPDDESIGCGGTMAKAVAAGRRMNAGEALGYALEEPAVSGLLAD